MNYDELFAELFTITSNEGYWDFINHLNDSIIISDADYNELFDMACDIHHRYVGA